jgi:hypothetical protein
MHAAFDKDPRVYQPIGINPLEPNNASIRGRPAHEGRDRLASGGLPVVLSQTFRTLLQSRMQVGLAKYAQQYPAIDQVVFEPNEDDGEMFFTNIFSYSSRHRVCEHAFRSTLADLRGRREQLGPILLRHGLRLRDEVLDDHKLSVMDGVVRPRRQTDTTARLRRALDDIGELVQVRHGNRHRDGRRGSRPR